ncbi:MAG: hypothetical protein PHP52_14665 [Bacteroidales bacterium]|nr:hypothetical protein [Bacteroidales bacterium]MDD4218322.1 hypothetical protein [Bacteroidales bacterium]
MKNCLFLILVLWSTLNFAQNHQHEFSVEVETNIFFSGIHYQAKGNDMVKLEIFKALHINHGFSLILEDIPLSIAYFLNQYYETSKEFTFIQNLEKSCITLETYESIYFNPKFFTDFNRSSFNHGKVEVHGIGIEYPEWISVLALHDIIMKYEVPEELKELKKLVISLNAKIPESNQSLNILNPCYIDYRKLLDDFLQIEAEILKNKELCESLFGIDYYYFSRIVDSIVIYITNYNKNKSVVPVQVMTDIIVNNIIAIGNEYPDKKAFVQIGTCSAAKNCNSIAKLINERNDSPFFGKVESAIVYYKYSRKLSKFGWDRDQRRALNSLKNDDILKIYQIKNSDRIFIDKQNSYDFIIINDFR